MRAAIAFCVPRTNASHSPRHRVDRDDGSLQIEHIQQLGNCRDFVGFAVDGALREHEPGLGGVSRNQMQRARSVPRRLRSAQRLAVDRHDLSLEPTRRGRPSGEVLPKRALVDEAKDLAKRLRGRDAVGERQEAPKPVKRALGDRLDPFPVIRSTHHRHQNGQQDLVQRVRRHSRNPMIRHPSHVIQKTQNHGAILLAPQEAILVNQSLAI